MRNAFPSDLVNFFGASPDVVSDYMPPDHRQDATVAGMRLKGVVHVQAGWEGRGPLGSAGETAWLDGLEGGPLGIVGHADLSKGAAVGALLDAHLKASKAFRGVRDMLAHHPSRKVHSFCARGDMMSSPEFRGGLAQVAARGLSFDAWCYHHQLPALASMAAALPELPIVLCHLGTPIAVGGPYGDQGLSERARRDALSQWRDGLAQVAEQPNVVAKISGLTMPALGWGYHQRPQPPSVDELADDLRPLVAHALSVFGAERCMFASNFPVDRVSVPYETLYRASLKLADELAPGSRQQLFHDTASAFYRL